MLLMSNGVKWLLSFKVHLSNYAEVCDIWSDPKPYNRYYVHFCVPWILEVDSNHPHAGTTNYCICCLHQLSFNVGTHSICRP